MRIKHIPKYISASKKGVFIKKVCILSYLCSWARLLDGMDQFCASHFLGWLFYALIIRHYGVLWMISLIWEFTERIFAHLLPYFEVSMFFVQCSAWTNLALEFYIVFLWWLTKECWWDILFLDILLFNGVGIFVGMKICKYLEMQTYHWESGSSCMRFISVFCGCVFWQIGNLNTFFLRRFFEVEYSVQINCLILPCGCGPLQCWIECGMYTVRCTVQMVNTHPWIPDCLILNRYRLRRLSGLQIDRPSWRDVNNQHYINKFLCSSRLPIYYVSSDCQSFY